MPRPKLAKQRPSLRAPAGALIVPFSLIQTAREDLINILNCQKTGRRVQQAIIAEIETALGLYTHFNDELDNRPRAARRVRELDPILTNLRKASKQFKWLSEDAHEDILNQAADLVSRKMLITFRKRLNIMIQALAAACTHLGKRESRHGTTHRALKITVDYLNSSFSRHYRSGKGQKRPSRLIEFISAALEAGNLGSFDDGTIRRHLKASSPFS